jgi:hypothetical protein
VAAAVAVAGLETTVIDPATPVMEISKEEEVVEARAPTLTARGQGTFLKAQRLLKSLKATNLSFFRTTSISK